MMILRSGHIWSKYVLFRSVFFILIVIIYLHSFLICGLFEIREYRLFKKLKGF